MTRMNRLIVMLCMTGALGHVAACASGAPDADELTAADLAALPDVSDPDHADLAPAAVTPDDATLFDDADAVTVDDDELALELAPRAALLKSGLHPRASDALRSIGVTAGRILQTIGNAPASAGTHAQDGTFEGHAYSAATDLSVSGLSNTQIKNLLSKLAKVGFAAWFRWPGHDGWPASEVRHIHAVYANSKMKASLQSQVRSWLAGRNGLVSNTTYTFFTWPAADKTAVRNKFAQSDEGTTNGGSSCVVGGLYCGGDKISGDKNTLFRCTTGAPTVVKKCAQGCAVHPGSDDSCR
ncbi:MAG TPA: hypothetical protein VFP84_24055 [Kofleriaceae bacterium]|nr:hypothetical protein [Kofleriaceae bacterium]